MAVIISRKDTIADEIGTVDRGPHHSGKRRSSRVMIDIPVTVFGRNLDGKVFEEKTRTVAVSANGGQVVLKTAIDAEKPITLVRTGMGTEVQCRVARRKEIEKGKLEISLEFLSPVPKFWGITFPPEDWNPADRKRPTTIHRHISHLLEGIES